MIVSTWSYLRNPFENVTKNSFRLMIIMAKDHLDKLVANANDPDIYAIIGFVKPNYEAFMQAFNNVQLNSGTYKSKTMQIEQLLSELSSKKVKQWDIAIQNEYLDDTVQYVDILPYNRAPFQRGAYEERVNAVSILAQKLTHYPALATLQTDVQNFYNLLLNARSVQQGFEYQDAQLRMEVEKKRQELATALHKSFASLLVKYIDNVVRVESYFELQYLRSSNSGDNAISYQTFIIPANGKIVAFANRAVAGKFLSIKNNSLDTLNFFVSNLPNAISGSAEIAIRAGESEENIPVESISESANALGNLIIVNNSASNLTCEVALV